MSQVTSVKTWDVLDEGGSSVLSFTSFLDSTFKGEAKAVEQPVEEGSFATYNKVISSRPMTFTLALEGDDGTLTGELETLEELRVTASKCQVVTPYGISPMGTLTNYDYTHKRESGLGMIVVALTLTEIREVGAQTTSAPSGRAGGSSTKPITQEQASSASDASPTDSGKVQGQEPKKSTLTKIGDWAGS